MKINLFVILLACVFLLGCSSVQRYKDFENSEKNTVAILCKYERSCQNGDRFLVESFERAFTAKGFQVVNFKAFDKDLDYVVVIDWDTYPQDYMSSALVDYQSKKIVGRMSYKPFSKLNRKDIGVLVDDLFKAPVEEPHF